MGECDATRSHGMMVELSQRLSMTASSDKFSQEINAERALSK